MPAEGFRFEVRTGTGAAVIVRARPAAAEVAGGVRLELLGADGLRQVVWLSPAEARRVGVPLIRGAQLAEQARWDLHGPGLPRR